MHYKTVKIGIGSAYDFFFEVARPNIDRFLSDPSPVTAINVAWPLWHLHDWYYWESHPSGNDQGRKAFARELIKNECPELGWFRDIADAAKHLKLNRGSVSVDAILIRIYDGGMLEEVLLPKPQWPKAGANSRLRLQESSTTCIMPSEQCLASG